MALGLRYRGHRCVPGGDVVPWYFRGRLELEPGQTFAVPPGRRLVLGRGRNADVRIASNGVARAHALVSVCPDGLALVATDLDTPRGIARGPGSFQGPPGESAAPGGELRLSPGDILTVAGHFDFEVIGDLEPGDPAPEDAEQGGAGSRRVGGAGGASAPH